MMRRCYSTRHPAHYRYGGRGIKVCDRWHDFLAFLADMGQRPSLGHSLDRIDNEGNYEPGNCRWATRTEQARNRRTSRFVEIDGERKTLVEWGEISGINPQIIGDRFDRGWKGRDLLSRGHCTSGGISQ
jgi:hypothetical protein